DRVAVGKSHTAVGGWSTSLGMATVVDWPPQPLREPPPPSMPMYPIAFASLAFSPDDGLLIAGTKGGAPGRIAIAWEKRAAIHVWDTKTGKEKAVLLGHLDWPLDLAFSLGGDGLVSAGKDGTLRFWTLP